MLNPATLISYLRLALIIVTADCIESGKGFLGLLAMTIASLSDIVDGYIARKFGYQSKFGALVDPIIDKCSLLLTFYFFPIVAVIIILLEGWGMIMSGRLRKHLKNHYISPISKQITAGQMGLIGLLILLFSFSITSGWPIYCIAAGLILLSWTRVSVYKLDWNQKEHL